MRLILLQLATALTLLMPAITHAQSSPKAIALTGATIIDANHPRGLSNQTILLIGDSIAAVTKDQSIHLPDSCQIIPLNGKFVLPGLIDTHVHMATDPSGTDNRTTTLNTLQKMLYSGVTAVRDMAGDARVLAGLSRDAALCEIPSPDIYYSALMAGPSFFSDPRTKVSTAGGTAGQMPYMQAVSDTTDLVLAVAKAKGTGATGIKLYAQLDAKLTAAIIKEATRQHILVWGHAYLNPAKPSEVVKAGISSISHAYLLKYDSTELPLVFRLMKENHTILDATISAYWQWAQQDTSKRFTFELSKKYTALAYKAGIPISAGTDDDQTAFVQEEMKLLVHDAGLTPADAIIAATLTGAKAIGIDNRQGTIAIGKKASLLILSQNPLTDIANIDSVQFVIKSGKIYQHP